MIAKLPNGKWRVWSEPKKDSKTGKNKRRNLGTYETKAEAEERLKQVEMFKHMKQSEQRLRLLKRYASLISRNS